MKTQATELLAALHELEHVVYSHEAGDVDNVIALHESKDVFEVVVLKVASYRRMLRTLEK